MLIDLNSEVPVVIIDDHPTDVTVCYVKRTLPEGFTSKDGVLEARPIWGTDLFNVKVRPAIVDEPGRIDRWVISRSYPAGDYSGAYVDGEVQIDVLHPLNTPAITITVAGKTAIRLTQLTPLDLWDGQKLIEATTTVYDRLREEVDLIGERSY